MEKCLKLIKINRTLSRLIAAHLVDLRLQVGHDFRRKLVAQNFEQVYPLISGYALIGPYFYAFLNLKTHRLNLQHHTSTDS